MRVTAQSNLRRDYLLILLSLLVLHVGICQAQTDSSGFAIPLSIFLVSATFMCVCFWVCFCCLVWASKRRPHGVPANAQYTPYVYNQRPHYAGGAQPGSYPVQGYVVPSTTPGNPPQTQQVYLGSGQSYVPPSTVTAPYASPAPHAGATSQTVLQASEPVSLPEATLHQGDAPPGYAEAIGMKTVDIADQDKQQS